MKKLFFLISLLFSSILSYSAEYGAERKTYSDIRYVVINSGVNVRSNPTTDSKVVGKVEPGDVIYAYGDVIKDAKGNVWVAFFDDYVLKYVSDNFLRKEANPNYQRAEVDTSYNLLSGLKAANVPTWILITIAVLTLLFAFVTIWCCMKATRTRIFEHFGILSKSKFDLIPPLIGRLRHPNKDKYQRVDYIYGEGMRRNLFFCWEPYVAFLNAALIFVLSFLFTVALFIVIGGLVWLVCQLGSWTVYGTYWILTVGGYIGAAILGFASFGMLTSDEKGGGCLSFIGAGICLSLAIYLSGARGGWYDFAETLVDWGETTFMTFNVFEAAWELLRSCWLFIIVVALAPLLIFLCCAVLYFLFAGVLMIYESLVMRKYNVTHPCPVCGKPSEPAEYQSHDYPLPVRLSPGPWGLFHIVHPKTSERMPTLFLNGKDDLTRKCPHCDSLINAKVGVEKHIAIAGVPSSGKTTFLYRLISEMLRKKIGSESLCSMTDKADSDEAALQDFLSTISQGQAMTEYALKTVEGRHKAIQLLVNNPKSLLPYRMYINDIAGELFTPDSSTDVDSVSYLRNTNVLMLVIDPHTLNRKGLNFSDRMNKWYNSYAEENGEGKFNISEAVDAMIDKLEKYKGKAAMARMSLMITFTKADSGYLKGVDITDETALAAFARIDLGLSNVLGKIAGVFGDKNISYHAVSAAVRADDSGVPEMLDEIFDALDISFKDITEEMLKSNRIKADKHFKKSEEKKIWKGTYKHFDPDTVKFEVISTLIIFLVWCFLIASPLFYLSYASRSNYDEVTSSIQMASEQEPNNYGKLVNIAKDALQNKVFVKKHRLEIEELRDTYSRKLLVKTSELSGILKANFTGVDGRQSPVEISAKYKVMDNLKKVRSVLDEFKEIDPNNAEYLAYEKKFDNILKKYKVSL